MKKILILSGMNTSIGGLKSTLTRFGYKCTTDEIDAQTGSRSLVFKRHKAIHPCEGEPEIGKRKCLCDAIKRRT